MISLHTFFSRLCDYLYRRYTWYISDRIARHPFQRYNILNSFDSIRYIIDNRCSVSRYGDGELRLLYGYNIGFQKSDTKLVQRLKDVFEADVPNFVIGMPYFLKNVDGTVKFTREFWGQMVREYGSRWIEYLKPDKLYIDTQISRFFVEYSDYNRSTQQLLMLKQIWQDRDVVIIEGCESRTGVGNDLYDNAKSIKRILGYSKNGFDHYDEMLNAVKTHINQNEGYLLLLSYGPAATVLACDLAMLGYQAIDIGHLDMEYEHYTQKPGESKLKNWKYNNEVEGGDIVEECNDVKYLSQIIYDITK